MNKITISVNDALNKLHNHANLPTRCQYCGREMDPQHQVYGAGPVCRGRIGTEMVLQRTLLSVLGLDLRVVNEITPAVLPVI